MKIKKGDNVIIIAGKDKGKSGKVLRALPKGNKIVVEGVNIKKRHRRATRSNQHGQIIDITLPIDVSNAMISDPKTSKRTRVKYEVTKDKKERVAVKSGTKLS